MDTAHQWPQDAAPASDDQYSSRSLGDQKKLKPQKDQAPLNCPRCHSTNTKFCYYNNYSLTQPRYFCKACRRYWTAGGSLRNVPVGGGSRKNKRSSSSSLVSKIGSDNNDHLSSHFSFQNPSNFTNKPHDQNHNLNLIFPPSTQDYNSLDASRFLQKNVEMNKDNSNIIQLNLNSSYSTSSSSTSTSLSAMELIKLNSTGFPARGSHTSVPVQNPNMMMQYASAGFQFQEFNNKSQLGFANNDQEGSINGSAADQRLNFPFGAPNSSKHNPTENGVDNQDKVFWNGMSSGGSW